MTPQILKWMWDWHVIKWKKLSNQSNYFVRPRQFRSAVMRKKKLRRLPISSPPPLPLSPSLLMQFFSDVGWSNPNPCKWDTVQWDGSSCITRNQLRQKGIRGTLPPDLHKLSELVVLETHVRRSEKTEQRRRGRQSNGVGAELVVLETHESDVGEDRAAGSEPSSSSSRLIRQTSEKTVQRRRRRRRAVAASAKKSSSIGDGTEAGLIDGVGWRRALFDSWIRFNQLV